jgi:hypothetical protein
VEIALAAAAPPGLAAIARALLAPHGAEVEEASAAGDGWRLAIALPPAAADAGANAPSFDAGGAGR